MWGQNFNKTQIFGKLIFYPKVVRRWQSSKKISKPQASKTSKNTMFHKEKQKRGKQPSSFSWIGITKLQKKGIVSQGFRVRLAKMIPTHPKMTGWNLQCSGCEAHSSQITTILQNKADLGATDKGSPSWLANQCFHGRIPVWSPGERSRVHICLVTAN